MKETKLNNDEILLIDGHAHCDGPCGVYDPASARVAAEAVQSMTKKMNALETNHGESGLSLIHISEPTRPLYIS